MPGFLAAIDIPTLVHGFLPKTMTLPNGDVVAMDWYDAREDFQATQHPYGTFALLSQTQLDGTTRYFGDEPVGTVAQDTFAYASGTLDYAFVNQDVVSIEQVSATVGGTPGTILTDGVDYELLSAEEAVAALGTGMFIEFGGNVGIRFLGATVPDDTTNVIVDYTHQLGNELQVFRSNITYRLALHAKPLASGSNGATQDYAKSHLAQYLADYLQAYLRYNAGRGLTAVPGEFVVGPTQNLGVMPIDQAEELERAFIDIRFKRRYKAASAPFEFIRRAEVTDINVGA